MNASLNVQRCDRCTWHLTFIRKPGRWVALCLNPSCSAFEAAP